MEKKEKVRGLGIYRMMIDEIRKGVYLFLILADLFLKSFWVSLVYWALVNLVLS